LLFYFEQKLHFSLKKEDCLKKTALSDYFLRILIDKLGPYMCYTKIYLSEILLPIISFKEEICHIPKATIFFQAAQSRVLYNLKIWLEQIF
jgi:hypothetical protein